MGRFIIKLLFFLSPVLVVLGIYAYKDPFRVLYHYDNYHAANDSTNFELNEDYISTQSLVQRYAQEHYDAYIFGSSRSDNFLVSEWSKHIHDSACYHYDASWETLYGMERKFHLLNDRHYPIKYALLIMDHELLAEVKNGSGHLRIKHPLITGQNVFAFQSVFLKDFFDKDFLTAYLDMLYSGKVKQYMITKGVMVPDRFSYNASSNEYIRSLEQRIKSDTNAYYTSMKHIFYTRDTQLHYSKPVIGAEQIERLTNIRNILNENHTDYRIVISPLYDQQQLDTADLKTLQQLFGKEHVADFSGINSYTASMYNYYETSHFRIGICTDILNTIYK